MPKVLILTHIPSPYQVEYFNALSRHDGHTVSVAYLYERSAARFWEVTNVQHESLFLNDERSRFESIEVLMPSVDLVVFNYYQHPNLTRLIKARANSGQAWCFWGERPGYWGFERLGTVYRKWKLAALHDAPVSIWGIGEWAVERYRREFGTHRHYFNVPYYSDLDRFAPAQSRVCHRQGALKFLYSGSLIHRKGVDLLASAFGRLADEFPSIELDVVGEGELRSSLERQLSKHQARVRFWGFKDWNELPALYWNSDVLCVPSRHDGWGLVVPEGLAAGMPVIGTDRTGAARELLSERNGWIVTAGDEECLYQAMRKAVVLPTCQFSELASAARQTVSQHSLSGGVERFLCAVHGTLAAFDQKPLTILPSSSPSDEMKGC